MLLFSYIRSLTQSCPTLCIHMGCSMPGLPAHHQLLEFTQTHVHWVGDAIQPSHPLSSLSPPATKRGLVVSGVGDGSPVPLRFQRATVPSAGEFGWSRGLGQEEDHGKGAQLTRLPAPAARRPHPRWGAVWQTVRSRPRGARQWRWRLQVGGPGARGG